MYELSYFKKKIRLKFDQIKLQVIDLGSHGLNLQIHTDKTFLLHPVFTINSKIFPKSNF